MLTEQNTQQAIATKYNLFSPNEAIQTRKPDSRSKKSKVEIKLVFHHPNLLFLNSKKIRSKEQASREVGENIIQSLKNRSKHMHKSTSNFRPQTSFEAEKERSTIIRNSAINTPWVRRSHTEEALEICGRSSCLTNELIRNPNPYQSNFKTHGAGLFPHPKGSSDENLFRFLEGKQGQQIKQKWGQLMHQKANRHAVRLNMYFSVEKKYLKYVSKCR